MDNRKLRHRAEWLAQQAKIVAKSVANGNHAFAAEERPRLAKARADVLNLVSARDHKAVNPKLDRIIECATAIEQSRFKAWEARRKADQIRHSAEADLKEAEIESLIVEISGHLGDR